MKLDWKSSIIACISVFGLFLAIHYWSTITSFAGTVVTAASTLVLGAAIAYVVNILMRMFEKKIAPDCSRPVWVKARRPVCMLLSFVTLGVVAYLLVQLIVPQLVDCLDKLVSALVSIVPRIYAWLNEHVDIAEFLKEAKIPTTLPTTNAEWRGLLEQYANVLLTGVGGFMNAAVNITTSLMSIVITLIISITFACNILAGKEQIGRHFDRLFARIFGEKLMHGYRHVLEVLDSCFHSYIVGQLMEAVILGSLCALGMLVLRLDYPLMISAVIGVTALIPFAGSYIGAAIGAIMLFSVEPVKAVIFIVFLLVLQQIEGNLIYPRTVGGKLHLPGIWVLAAVTVGGGVMGIMGMLLSVPLTATIYRLLAEWTSENDKPSLVEKIAAIDKHEAAPPVQATDPEPCEPTHAIAADAAKASRTTLPRKQAQTKKNPPRRRKS